jgi:SAM-dependent methyltransferase
MKSETSIAFGVEPGYPPYSLRQARYHALAEDVAGWIRVRGQDFQTPVDLVDVGVYDGVSRRYIEVHPENEAIRYHGVDLYPHGQAFVYRHDQWVLHTMDLEHGLPDLSSDSFPLVICEQVLEHLHVFERTLCELGRILAPNGLLVVGVPIFPHGIHLIRKHVVPVTDRLFRVKKVRGHVQAFSQRTFLRAFRSHCGLQILKIRGFRVASEGMLTPLEHSRTWWWLNRRFGEIFPWLCTEIQVLATKPALLRSSLPISPEP